MATVRGVFFGFHVLLFLHFLKCIAMPEESNKSLRIKHFLPENNNDCVIHVTLYSEQTDCQCLLIWMNDTITTKFMNCTENTDDYQVYQTIKLDGKFCEKLPTDGVYEFSKYSKCDKFIEATVEHFNSSSLNMINCVTSQSDQMIMQLKAINIINNTISTIEKSAFENLPHLEHIHLSGNSLTHIDGEAFQLSPIVSLEIHNEPKLNLTDNTLFDNSIHIEHIKLIGLGYMSNQMFQFLPASILTLFIAKTNIEFDSVELIYVPSSIQDITIVNCNLKSFTLLNNSNTLKFLNLSGNTLEQLNVAADNIEILDLSSNELEEFPINWLQSFNNLQKLLLRHNYLKVLAFDQVLIRPSLTILDLRDNRMTHFYESTQWQRPWGSKCRIQVDHNPWDCLWILGFARAHPEMFRKLQYEKYISRINVNGLECESVPAGKKIADDSIQTTKRPFDRWRISNDTQYANVSTYALAFGTVGARRNQRAEAIVIVFMLPVGIALLFVILYMYIYCERIFHLSFYYPSNCLGFGGKSSSNRGGGVEHHCDVVRHFPPGYPNGSGGNHINQIDDGYEMPVSLNSDLFHCDCTNGPSHTHKCQRHNVTYVPLPDEEACKIYEEIIAEGVAGKANI